jgi:hypothetical protein
MGLEDAHRGFTRANSPEGNRLCATLAISRRWAVPRTRILVAEQPNDQDYGCILGEPAERMDKLTRAEFESRLHAIVEPQVLVRQVYVLTGAGVSSQLRRSKKGEPEMADARGGSIIGTSRSMSDIARSLEPMLDAAVVDETGLTGRFDYSALTKLRGEDAAIDWAHQLGLELTEAVQPIEMLVVRRTQ